jgi:ankyrin repeat protein
VSGGGWFLRGAALGAAALVFLGAAMPAQAQFSASFKFLDAVRKADGATAEEALNKPGSTIINTRDSTTGETALHIVVKRRDKTWLAYLLQHGADPNVRDRAGVAPIQIAVGLGFAEGVELLLQYRADVSQANDAGETPLITATHRRDLQMVRLLLGGGADPSRPDNSGRTAMDYAKQDGQDQILATLTAAAKSKPQRDPTKPTYGPNF